MKHAALFFLFGLLLSACSPDVQKTIPKNPQRIVSLAPSITECIHGAGATDRLVGVTRYCDYPGSISGLPRIGGMTDTNFEAVYKLKPDLIIVQEEHNASAERLDSLGIPYLIINTSTIPDIFESLRLLGGVFQTEAAAEATIRRLERRMAEIAEITKDAPKRKVLISVGRNMGTGGLSDVYVAGRTTLYNEMLELIGAENVYSGNLKYARLSSEGILRLEPDVVIDLIPDLEKSVKMSARQVQSEWDDLVAIPAVQNGEVYVFGDDYVCVPGPRFILVLDDIARVVHPGLFAEVVE
ncbi:MAG: helical backbone metal receptor [Verrucomicrobiota bacterium]